MIDQTEKDWELIIVDDGSTDNTFQIAQEFAAKDNRIRVISNKANRLLPAALNVGFATARGEYMTWTSDDNLYKADAFATMIDWMDKNPDAVGATFLMSLMDEGGQIPNTRWQPPRGVRNLIVCSNCGGAFIYRKSAADIIGMYDETVFCAEDYDYFIRLALLGTLDYVDKDIYLYRLHSTSLSSTQEKRQLTSMRAVRKKYIAQFLNKYDFNYYECAKAYHLTKLHAPLKYLPLSLLFQLNHLIACVIVLPFQKNTRTHRRIWEVIAPRRNFNCSRVATSQSG